MITLRAVRKDYDTPAGSFRALKDLDLDVAPGEAIAIVGRSGSGKSTLLHLVGGIDRPTAGLVSVGGADLGRLNGGQLATWRGANVGIVFQFFQLLPTLTVAENVMLPMDFAGKYSNGGRRTRALELLEQVGVKDQAGKLPSTLSGGQQQRVAIARALANDPPVILADEPTGNLDSTTGEAILELFAGLAAAGKTVLIVTHERGAIPGAVRTITLADGAVVS